MAALAERGHVPQLLVSHALDSRSQLLAWNGSPGWVYMLEHFVLKLMDAGFDAHSVRSLIVDNPARAYTIAPEPHA
jgi:predicted metal-dependent phosphotriesterase family hydrolase